jgi:fatty-acyl-CoA synthase
VQEAAVIGMPDERWGERPLAIVAPTQAWKDRLTPEELKAHMLTFVEKGALTSWAVPDQYVMVDEIPKTSVGKLDKKILRSQHVGA